MFPMDPLETKMIASHDAENNFTGTVNIVSSNWLYKVNFGGLSLGLAISGLLILATVLLGFNFFLREISVAMGLLCLSLLCGIASIIGAHGKHWGKNKDINNQLKHITRKGYLMGRMGILLSLGGPVILIGGFLILIFVGLSSM